MAFQVIAYIHSLKDRENDHNVATEASIIEHIDNNNVLAEYYRGAVSMFSRAVEDMDQGIDSLFGLRIGLWKEDNKDVVDVG